MKKKFKVGDQVIITRLNGLHKNIRHTIEVGKVGTVVSFGLPKGVIHLKEYNDLYFEANELTHVMDYPETNELILDRFFTNEVSTLKQFVLGVIGIVFFVLGSWFLIESNNNVINFFSGTIAMAGATFCLFVIREDVKKNKSLRNDFNGKLVAARLNDLIN